MVRASGGTVPRTRTGQRPFVPSSVSGEAAQSIGVRISPGLGSGGLDVIFSRSPNLGEGRSPRGRVWTSFVWRSWGQDFLIKTGRRVEVAGSLAWLGRSHTAVSSGKDIGWRRRGEWRDGERRRERRRIPESNCLSWSDIKPFLGGSGALGPAKFRVYGHGRQWGPGASPSPGGSFQLRGLEGDLACEPFSLREADKAGGPERRENDPNVELVERARTSVAKGWERRARSELRWRQSRVDPVEPRGRVVRKRLSR